MRRDHVLAGDASCGFCSKHFACIARPQISESVIAFYATAHHVTCERRVEIRETSVTAAKVGGLIDLAWLTPRED